MLLALACGLVSAADWADETTCGNCHASQVQAWQGSHHQLAMQVPSETSVLGNFDNVQFAGERENYRFFRREGGWWVNATGPDGRTGDWRVAYTFGITPLQQYLLAFPGGRLQALGVAWDSEKQRWFELYPGLGVDFKDPLHWSQPGQNANFMCIECHSTGYKRNYQPEHDRFEGHWQALGVTCQACHGPAAQHLQWLAERPPIPHAGFASALVAGSARNQVETCARCHSRRVPLADGDTPGAPLLDNYLPTTLSADLYEHDGKIKEEVFEYGAFVQSRMYAKGVRCSNCHDPHSTRLKAPGNGLCLQCHNAAGRSNDPRVDGSGLLAKDYDSPAHHKTLGSSCIACHMPGRFYMVNDLRHDHGFTLPGPGQKVSELFNLWQAARPGSYSADMPRIRLGQPGASEALLRQLADPAQPALRLATLLEELPAYPSRAGLTRAIQALDDPDPQVRVAAVQAVDNLVPGQWTLLGPRLSDPIKAVRLAAVGQLLDAPGNLLWQAAWLRGTQEYEKTQESLSERAEAHVNLARLYRALGRDAEVEAQLRLAQALDRHFLPAPIMLAQWLQRLGRGEAARQVLEEAIAGHPKEAQLHYALGLIQVSQGMPREALATLSTAVKSAPLNASYAYTLAVAKIEQHDRAGAKELLEKHRDYQPARELLAHLTAEGI
ncbi:tetratricopeptide repeat protein [Pseudomonas hunanensis]|uniref:tetratricopeptide repeat protein n=1 Tax=Pseudomonas hunanensis TaxID=1247546 RepID=UPI0015BFA14B|nr:multiheme c-type cytochrome [Pseudomonas hunanensis]